MGNAGLRVGADIQSIDEVSRSIATFGPRYLDRVFTAHEVESSGGFGEVGLPSLTSRFAAKEAFFKVLRSPDLIPPWTSVEVVRSPHGWTDLHLHGSAVQMADQAGIAALAVSLSQGAGYGMAVVVATLVADGNASPPHESLRELDPWTN